MTAHHDAPIVTPPQKPTPGRREALGRTIERMTTYDETVAERAASVDEIARELKVAPITVRRAIRRGEIRAFKIGRLLRVPRSEIERILACGSLKHAPA